jgi:hypothetical protein
MTAVGLAERILYERVFDGYLPYEEPLRVLAAAVVELTAQLAEADSE